MAVGAPWRFGCDFFCPLPQVHLFNLAELNPTVVNEEPVTTHKKLANGDVFVVGDRKFRIQYSAWPPLIFPPPPLSLGPR